MVGGRKLDSVIATLLLTVPILSAGARRLSSAARAAYFAILGFAVVLFTVFGVTYLLPGLHAYG